MKAADPIDTARVELLLAELRLPAIKQVWASLAAQPKGGLAGGPLPRRRKVRLIALRRER